MELDFAIQKVEQALWTIEAALAEPPSLGTLSAQVHLSPFYFHRVFSAVMGRTLKQYVSSRRINRAVQLIQETNLSLTQIGYNLGFADQAAFTRSFRNETGLPPSRLRKGAGALDVAPVPIPVQRSFKNMKGDLVADFSLDDFSPVEIRGIAFEVDLADEGFRDSIRSRARQVREVAPNAEELPSYMIYSGCQPGSTVFRALFGVPCSFEADLPNLFTVTIPPMFCARFRYRGDLLEIGEVFAQDFARFLKIVQVDPVADSIELVQVFDPGDLSMLDYRILVPVVKTSEDTEALAET